GADNRDSAAANPRQRVMERRRSIDRRTRTWRAFVGISAQLPLLRGHRFLDPVGAARPNPGKDAPQKRATLPTLPARCWIEPCADEEPGETGHHRRPRQCRPHRVAWLRETRPRPR